MCFLTLNIVLYAMVALGIFFRGVIQTRVEEVDNNLLLNNIFLFHLDY